MERLLSPKMSCTAHRRLMAHPRPQKTTCLPSLSGYITASQSLGFHTVVCHLLLGLVLENNKWTNHFVPLPKVVSSIGSLDMAWQFQSRVSIRMKFGNKAVTTTTYNEISKPTCIIRNGDLVHWTFPRMDLLRKHTRHVFVAFPLCALGHNWKNIVPIDAKTTAPRKSIF